MMFLITRGAAGDAAAVVGVASPSSFGSLLLHPLYRIVFSRRAPFGELITKVDLTFDC